MRTLTAWSPSFSDEDRALFTRLQGKYAKEAGKRPDNPTMVDLRLEDGTQLSAGFSDWRLYLAGGSQPSGE